MTIAREPAEAARRRYNLIIVGGGMYGVMLALEASLRELSVLLLEKEDFGGATSYNSLRIVHGGLRDLQTLNLRRYWTFGRERRWFLEHFPNLVERLPVLIPLYQRGLLRTDLFKIAFLLDRVLLPRRDRTISGTQFFPPGKIISASEVKKHFPQVDDRGLSGGAFWYDAAIPDTQRLIIEVLLRVCRTGSVALNYMPAVELLQNQNQVVGVRSHDALHGMHYDFSSKVVINAAGPWCQDVALRFDQDIPGSYCPSVAWNILFDQEAPSDCALGIRPPASGEQLQFLHPWKGRLLAGTGHAPREAREEVPQPSLEEIHAHLDDLNEAIPKLQLAPEDILHVYAGYLPVQRNSSVRLAKEDRFVDHGTHGGPVGLYSVQSTKLTAARRTAEKVLSEVFPDRSVTPAGTKIYRNMQSKRTAKRGVWDYAWYPNEESSSWRDVLIQIIREESVHHLEDLILRRTSLGDNPVRALNLAPTICELFDWNEARRREEIRRIEDHFRWLEKSPESHVNE